MEGEEWRSKEVRVRSGGGRSEGARSGGGEEWGWWVVWKYGGVPYTLCTVEHLRTHTLSCAYSWGPEDKGATVEGPGLVAQVRTTLRLSHTPSHLPLSTPPSSHRRL